LSSLGNRILTKVEVENEVTLIFQNKDSAEPEFSSFEDRIKFYSDNYNSDKKIKVGVSSICGSCEFNVSERPDGLLSGFHECWKEQASFQDEDFDKPSILRLWDFRKKQEYIQSGKYFLSELIRADLEGKTKAKKEVNGLSRVDRQEIQIEKAKLNNSEYYLDIAGLKLEMAKWVYPLHFIDFETSAVAIPFNKCRRPYEQIAFQFSHHIAHSDGRIEHSGERINSQKGIFPNFQFVRELKKQLDKDAGTIFRFAAHENSILNAIYLQLLDSSEMDKAELCDWIKTITKSKSSSAEKWEGARNMIDMRELVLRYYYDPVTNGSNSIKAVLPAILSASSYIQQRYSKPIYGNEIRSINFKDHIWVTFDKSGKTINPYKLLPSINDGYSSSTTPVDWWEHFMGLATYKFPFTAKPAVQLGVPTSDVSKYPFKYYPYDTGSNATAESGYCFLYAQFLGPLPITLPFTCSCSTTVWMGFIHNFPAFHPTTPFHMYNFYQSIKPSSTSYIPALTGTGLGGMGGGTPATYAAMQDACYHLCDSRYNLLADKVADQYMASGVKVDAYPYLSWYPHPAIDSVTLPKYIVLPLLW
jgi:hypothetical protein